jgi:hypothetical protein
LLIVTHLSFPIKPRVVYLKVKGWFYSFEINNWHGLLRSKNATIKRAGKGFLRSLSGKGRVHFSAKGIA